VRIQAESIPPHDLASRVNNAQRTAKGMIRSMTEKPNKPPTQKARPRRGVTYSFPVENPPAAIMEEALEYSVSCPLCDRRAFDISRLPQGGLEVRLKCPHCRKLIRVPFT
jgi:hypothetical protein